MIILRRVWENWNMLSGTQMDEGKKHVAVVLAVMNFWIFLPEI